MKSRKATRLLIPHDLIPGCDIVGTLDQVNPEAPTAGRKIALILHGTMGHKDYLFHKKLAASLPLDSYRFDFRGNNETPGVWTMGGFAEDVEDITTVAKYLYANMGYTVELIVGHSRGSVAAMRWVMTTEEGRRISAFVNVAGRYRMERIYEMHPLYKPLFEKQGFAEWKVVVAKKPTVGFVYPEDMDNFARWDNSTIWDQFPKHVDVLTIQGLQDVTIPPYDALIYARAFGARSPGTHQLHIVEDADHNFIGHYDEVVDTVLSWWTLLQQRRLTTGIWATGLRGKL